MTGSEAGIERVGTLTRVVTGGYTRDKDNNRDINRNKQGQGRIAGAGADRRLRGRGPCHGELGTKVSFNLLEFAER